MNIKKPLRRLAFFIAALLFLLLALTLYALSQSKFELNPNGVHKHLYIPLGDRNVKVLMHSATGDTVKMPGFLDGPIIRTSANGAWSATWFCENSVHRLQGNSPELQIDCAGRREVFPVSHVPAASPDVMPMPKKVAVMSDIEGKLGFFDASLARLNVTDGSGKWAYGEGHLVIVGDSVDRGRDVFGVLWRLYSLSLQAQRAGGGVHVLLGNHEQYILNNNTTRANIDHLYALGEMGGSEHAFAADTVIGRWLREQPVVLQMGDVLFAHGGISKEVADSGMSVKQLNDAMRAYWRGEVLDKPVLDAVLGFAGVTQYRGYLEKDKSASSADVASVLKRYGASTIVVGHTLVDKVETLYGGRVIAIDVDQNEAADETLIFENGNPRAAAVVDRNLPDAGGRGTLRGFRVADANDWLALGRLVVRTYELSRVRYPY